MSLVVIVLVSFMFEEFSGLYLLLYYDYFQIGAGLQILQKICGFIRKNPISLLD